jgi:hypothetical protein
MKAEIRMNKEKMETKIAAAQREFQGQLKLVKAAAENRTETGTGVAKQPKFSRTTSWAMFQRQCETV